MKRFIAILSLFLMVSFASPLIQGSAGAVDIFKGPCEGTAASGGTACTEVSSGKPNSADPNKPSTNNPIISIIKAAISIISIILGAAAIIGILISSIRFLTSGGDSGKVAEARTGLIYCLVGIAVAVLAQFIVLFVLDKFN